MDEDTLKVVVIVGALVAFLFWGAYAFMKDREAEKRETDGNPGHRVDRKDFEPDLDRNATFRVIRYRQSGQSEDLGTMSGSEAIRVARQTFQRSMSENFVVRKNTSSALTIDRGHVHMRGTKEGKKINRVVIEQVSPATPPRPIYQTKETQSGMVHATGATKSDYAATDDPRQFIPVSALRSEVEKLLPGITSAPSIAVHVTDNGVEKADGVAPGWDAVEMLLTREAEDHGIQGFRVTARNSTTLILGEGPGDGLTFGFGFPAPT